MPSAMSAESRWRAIRTISWFLYGEELYKLIPDVHKRPELITIVSWGLSNES